MNAQIGGVLRHVIESKFYSEGSIDFVLLSAQIAFGLLYAGRGAVMIDVEDDKTLGCLLALFTFAAPAAAVMTRPKCSMAYYLLAGCLKSKCVSFVDPNLQKVDVKARIGRVQEDFQAPSGQKLVGFSLHSAPVIRSVGQSVQVVQGGTAIWEHSEVVVC